MVQIKFDFRDQRIKRIHQMYSHICFPPLNVDFRVWDMMGESGVYPDCPVKALAQTLLPPFGVDSFLIGYVVRRFRTTSWRYIAIKQSLKVLRLYKLPNSLHRQFEGHDRVRHSHMCTLGIQVKDAW